MSSISVLNFSHTRVGSVLLSVGRPTGFRPLCIQLQLRSPALLNHIFFLLVQCFLRDNSIHAKSLVLLGEEHLPGVPFVRADCLEWRSGLAEVIQIWNWALHMSVHALGLHELRIVPGCGKQVVLGCFLAGRVDGGG